MWFVRTVIHYASLAWNALLGLPGDVSAALQEVWKFIGSVHTLLDHLVSVVLRNLHSGHLQLTWSILKALAELMLAVARIANWIWRHQVNPVRLGLLRQLARLRSWTSDRIDVEHRYATRLYFLALNYAYHLVALERKYRRQAVAAAQHRAAALVKGAIALIQRQASDGYNATRRSRATLIGKIADEIANRNPVIAGVVKDIVSLAIDALEVDDPVIRLVVGQLLTKVIDSLGIDKVLGSLLSSLLDDLIGSGPPRTLEAVTRDIGLRLDTLEQQWADFMAHGGPELEQAGDQWKQYGSLAFDVLIAGFFAQAVTSPQTWSDEVQAVAGTIVNGAVDAVAALVSDL